MRELTHRQLAFAGRYAFRNLGRSPRRTALTMATVLFSVAIAIIAHRYAAALMRLWEEGAADTGTAHAQLHAAGFSQKEEGVTEALTIAANNPFVLALRRDPDVAAVVPRLNLEGIVSTGDQSLYFVGKGVEAAAELAVSPRLFLASGDNHWIDDHDPSGIVVGKGLADTLNLKPGSEVTLITQTLQGSANGIDAHVVGIALANIPSFSQRSVFAPLALFQKLIRMPGRYTELAIRLKPGVDHRAWVQAQRAAAAAEAGELNGWWEIEPVIVSIAAIWDSVFAVITGLLFLSSALAVLNIIYMMVNERSVEIGTLMALGAKGRDVRLFFCAEAGLIGLGGGLIGAVLGNAVVEAMDLIGVPFENPFGDELLVVHPHVNLGVTAVILVVGVAISVIASLAPSRQAAGVEPLRALRGQLR